MLLCDSSMKPASNQVSPRQEWLPAIPLPWSLLVWPVEILAPQRFSYGLCRIPVFLLHYTKMAYSYLSHHKLSALCLEIDIRFSATAYHIHLSKKPSNTHYVVSVAVGCPLQAAIERPKEHALHCILVRFTFSSSSVRGNNLFLRRLQGLPFAALLFHLFSEVLGFRLSAVTTNSAR